jgi:Xaa-Pro aminopeptidase
MKLRLLAKFFVSIFIIASPSVSQSPAEWKKHREEFMRHLSNKSVAVFKAAEEYIRNGDVEHDYRQRSNFYYLTGLPEKEAMLLLIPRGIYVRDESKFVKEILFVMPRDPLREIWDGYRLGTEGAKKELGIEAAVTNERFEDFLQNALRGIDTLYIEVERVGLNEPLNKDIDFIKRARERLFDFKVADPVPILTQMREIKSPAEMALLRKAIDITCEAHREVMRSAKPGMREYELQAILEYIFKKSGAAREGFPSIVGSGPNSCILHYRAGDRLINDGEVVVLDIGAEYQMYTADVTRTIPINGKFSQPQADIYQIVYDAQEAAIKSLRPGAPADETRKISERIVTEGLVKLGILKGSVEENLKTKTYREFFMHGVSHYIGLDVHDVGRYDIWRPNAVITVEPGIYISEAAGKKNGVDPKYWNIGVRIEDCVLITENGHELLSGSAPRTMKEIEELMAQPGWVDKSSE